MKVYVDAAAYAWRNKNGGAYRMHLWARALDRSGCGWVRPDELHTYVLSLGVPEWSYRRWFDQAVRLGVLKPGRQGWLKRVSEANAVVSTAPGLSHVVRAVEMDARDLAGKDWKARVMKATYALAKGKPISRDTLRDITGTAPNSQRRFDIQMGVREPEPGRGECKRRNYAIIQKSAKQHLAAYKEFGGERYFAFKVKGARYAQIAYRLPNSYYVKDQLARKGRLRKINAELRTVVTTPAAIVRPSRIYCATSQQAARSDRELTYTLRAKQSFRSTFWTEHREAPPLGV